MDPCPIPPCPSAIPAGAGEPVQTGGTVPGWVAMGSLGEQALNKATGTMNRTATAGLRELEGLAMERA